MGTDENSDIATTFNNMGLNYGHMGQMDEALEVYQKAYGLEKIRCEFY